jgi:hypothetical protein
MIMSTDNPEGRDLTYHLTTIIAERTGTAVSDLPPLYDAIDPEALDSFLRADHSDTHTERSVEFSYAGFRVSADSTGQVDLQPEPESTAVTPPIRD